jgi:hypothetical protein
MIISGVVVVAIPIVSVVAVPVIFVVVPISVVMPRGTRHSGSGSAIVALTALRVRSVVLAVVAVGAIAAYARILVALFRSRAVASCGSRLSVVVSGVVIAVTVVAVVVPVSVVRTRRARHSPSGSSIIALAALGVRSVMLTVVVVGAISGVWILITLLRSRIVATCGSRLSAVVIAVVCRPRHPRIVFPRCGVIILPGVITI